MVRTARHELERRLDAHTAKGLGRLALALGLDQAGIRKDKIRRLADYHEGRLNRLIIFSAVWRR